MISELALPLAESVVDELRALGRADVSHHVELAPHCRGALRGEIVLPACHACQAAHWYPALLCPHCGAADWRWRSFGTTATLDSWTVVRHAMAPALRDHVPFVVGLVCPDEAPGVRLVSALVAGADTPLRIGQPLVARPGPQLDNGRLLVFASGEVDG